MQVTGRNIPNMIKQGGVTGSGVLIILVCVDDMVGGFVDIVVNMVGK